MAMKWLFNWLQRQAPNGPTSQVPTGAMLDAQIPFPALEWRFREVTPDDTLQNASHIEFFHTEALQSAVEGLVREDIQNRLDARAENHDKVLVRYILGQSDEAPHPQWFHKLAPHIGSPQVSEELGSDALVLDRPLRWLAIEDFRTTGLQGDPMCFQDPLHAGSSRNDFYWFIRNIGRSGKQAGDRGRWGLGKLVYPLASEIRSYFAYTVRKTDMKRLLIGRSTLKMHRVHGRQHDSEGYFGQFEIPHHPYFASPETDQRLLDQFAFDFKLSRAEDEPGLSLVIPWPDDDITYDSLIESLLRHWFWVLLTDQIEVEVAMAGSEQVTSLTRDSLLDSLGDKKGNAIEDLRNAIAFGLRVRDFRRDEGCFFPLRPGRLGYAPKWDNAADQFTSPEALVSARAAFRAGHLIMFEVPVRVKRNDESLDELSSFEVYLQRCEGDWRATEVFLRDGLAITGMKSLLAPGTTALIKVDGGALGTLLGDAENPAHTRWERGNRNFRGRYEHGSSVLTYVQRSAEKLCNLLSK